MKIQHIYLCFLALALSLAAAPHTLAAARLSPTETRFYRAVCVLQSMGGPAAEEKVTIPKRVRYADATESLLNHPDKTFALRQATEELDALALTMPEALLFAAYGNLALNENQKAVAQLRQYTATAPYKPRAYEILCETLHAMQDYETLEIVLADWEAKAPQCTETRLFCTFSLLYHQEKYAEARQYLARMQPCGGWKAQIYAAKATKALGHSRQAEAEIKNILNAYPKEARTIELTWERLKDQDTF